VVNTFVGPNAALYFVQLTNNGASGKHLPALKLLSDIASTIDASVAQLSLRHNGYVSADLEVGMDASGNFGISWDFGAGPATKLTLAPSGDMQLGGGLRVGADPIGVAGFTTFSNAFGVGNGAVANLQAPAVGTGSGPVSLTAVQFVKIRIGTAVHWVAAFA
jgi:hypothetical protein